MELQRIGCNFSVCKIARIEDIDFSREYVFLSKTSDEISLVCETEHTPPDVLASEPNWRALKISGILDFGMIGVIAKISCILAEAKISVFVVSTYNTDYILMKSENFDSGVSALSSNGYAII
ncbi:MAG: ACT domain-containing protein [Defluviitaleaceae bacterium]|nr:ACT domain-containing protein [Defluviitaleaceae bacterium]